MILDNILQSFRQPYTERKFLGLDRMKEILKKLGNPQNNFYSVHIAGTNGKGSVSAMISSVFANFNLKVGLFTSPHLERFTERIKINDKEIPEKDFLTILNYRVLPVVENLDFDTFGKPTEFEIITAVAFCYFSENKIDIAVIEAGLGGRVDATNTLSKIIISIITSISFDHVDRLGMTLEKITLEKAGIIKTNIPIVTTLKNPHHEIFKDKTELVYFADSHDLTILEQIINSNTNLKTKVFYPKIGMKLLCNNKNSIFYNKQVFIPFIAKYQIENLSIVLTVLDLIFKAKNTFFNYSPEEFLIKSLKGIEEAKWFGRFELIYYDDKKLLLDGAHNEAGMGTFVETLKDFAKGKKVITIFACNKDKDFEKMLKLLMPVTDYFILTQSHVKIKAKDLDIMGDFLVKLKKPHKIVKEYSQTINIASKIISEEIYDKHNTIICACGSLYLVGVIRALVNSN